MIVYFVDIDQWSGWQRPEAVFCGEGDNYDDHRRDAWAPLWAEALRLAGYTDADGPIVQGPLVTVLPNLPGDFSPGAVLIGWKTRRMTFVASERFDIPWLDPIA
jgi:hypothetical protein